MLLGQGTALGDGFPSTNNLTAVFTGSNASDRYIGITLSGFSEIQPRLQLLASPYALLAQNANNLVGNTGKQVINANGTNVGINQAPGSESLDLNGTMGIVGHNTLQFGVGLAGQQQDAGKIGYEAFSASALDLIGAGTASNNRKIKLWGEGGTSTTGPLGIGTDTPATMLHVYSAGSPEISIQSSHSGHRWTLQSTSGLGRLPGSLQIIDRTLGVNRLIIDTSGRVGINNSGPTDALDVGGNVGASSLTLAGAVLNEGALSLGSSGHLNDNALYIRGGTDHNHWLAYNNSLVGTDGPGLMGCNGGFVGHSCLDGPTWDLFWYTYYNGSGYTHYAEFRGIVYATAFTVSSDRKLKTDFENIDEQKILAGVAALPITRWSFTNSPTDRHIGPMAQDFFAAFGGQDAEHISLGDETAVALAAIKGLNTVVEQKDAEIQTLKKQVQALQAAVENLNKAVGIKAQGGSPTSN